MFSEITDRIAVASAFDVHPANWRVLDVRGLIDGPGNAESLIQDYISAGLHILEDPTTRLLVVCDYGQSRSNFIAAQVHSKIYSSTLDESLELVRRRHPDSQMKPALLVSKNKNCIHAEIKRIAVTGGRGFIGARLCAHLTSTGFECMALTRSDHGEYLGSSAQLNSAIPNGCDLLIHFAHPKPYNSESTSKEAMAQLISVVEYCLDHGTRLLFPSSWVVFDGSSEETVSHTTPKYPHTRYGRLKATAEAYLHFASTQGLVTRVLRLPGIFGEDSLEPRFLRYFAECVTNGQNIVFHHFVNGSARVPLANVDACVKAIGNAAADFDNLPFLTHVGSSTACPTVREIAERLAVDTGRTTSSSDVGRTVFRGHFVPDICIEGSERINDEIVDFIIQLCREPYGSR